MKRRLIRLIKQLLPVISLLLLWSLLYPQIVNLIDKISPTGYFLGIIPTRTLHNEKTQLEILVYMTAWIWTYVEGFMFEVRAFNFHHFEILWIAIRWMFFMVVNLFLPFVMAFGFLRLISLANVSNIIILLFGIAGYLYFWGNSWRYPMDRMIEISQGMNDFIYYQ